SALQPDCRTCVATRFNQDLVDAGLRRLPPATPFADIDDARVRPGELEDAVPYERIVNDDVGDPQEPCGSAGKKARIPRPGADEVDGSAGPALRTPLEITQCTDRCTAH